jgi:DNA-binding NarL/FixJ family response regulator
VKQLTEKQQQVLQLLSDGCTQKEIACALKISHRTVEGYLEKIRKNLGYANNENVIKFATKQGLIE